MAAPVIPNNGKDMVSLPNPPSDTETKCKDSNLAKSIIIYYPEWKYYNYPPRNLPFNKLTHINYAFGEIDPTNYSLKYDSTKFLELIETARSRNKNVKIIMSVGGWTGSRYFSVMSSNPANRSKFISSVKSMLESTGADGIDIDWEHPGVPGAFYDSFDAQNDTYNLLKLMQELREAIGKSKIISTAVTFNLFVVNYQPLQDLSKFAEILDYINLMCYDFNGSWSNIISHQSSLYPTGGNDSGFSVEGAVKNWMNAKFPSNKIVIGIPSYGISWISSTSNNNGLLQIPSNSFPKGDEEDVMNAESGRYSGIWKYKNLRKQILQSSFKDATGDWIRVWDSKSSVPYLYNKVSRQFITYDDPESVKIKADYVIERNLGGMMMWEIEEDTKDGELISTVYDNFIGLTCDDVKNIGNENKNKHIVDSGLDLDLEEIPTNSSSTNALCPNASMYKCCKSCNIVLDDGDKWGVENGEWCSITNECVEKIKKCWAEAYGYPCCSKCLPVIDTTNDKEWALENGNWCGLPSKC
jgi:chitinase